MTRKIVKRSIFFPFLAAINLSHIIPTPQPTRRATRPVPPSHFEHSRKCFSSVHIAPPYTPHPTNFHPCTNQPYPLSTKVISSTCTDVSTHIWLTTIFLVYYLPATAYCMPTNLVVDYPPRTPQHTRMLNCTLLVLQWSLR